MYLKSFLSVRSRILVGELGRARQRRPGQMSEELRPQLQGHAQEESATTSSGVRVRRRTEIHVQHLLQAFLAEILFVHSHGHRAQTDDELAPPARA